MSHGFKDDRRRTDVPKKKKKTFFGTRVTSKRIYQPKKTKLYVNLLTLEILPLDCEKVNKSIKKQTNINTNKTSQQYLFLSRNTQISCDKELCFRVTL